MAQKLYKFRATSFEEAYSKMHSRLGEDATVIRTAQIREGGVLGFFGKNLIELTAAAPVIDSAERMHTPVALNPQIAKQESKTVEYFERLVSDAQHRMAINNPSSGLNSIENGNTVVAPIIPFKKQDTSRTDGLRKEMREMREMLQVLTTETPGAGLPAEFSPFYRMLLEQGVSRKVAAGLVASVVNGSDIDMLRDRRLFIEKLRFEIRKCISVTGGITLTGGRCKKVAFVGPTGVGKTTNLAKLAALLAVRECAKVALITADTYRIAAPEQLRVYANIIGIQMEVVNDPREMASALKMFKDCDIVLIDTAGGSQFNIKQINEMKSIMSAVKPDEVMLTLGANTQLPELRNIVSGFRCLNLTSMFFTKFDETRQYGSILNMALEADLPLSYFSTGQNVPDDIVLAHQGMVANLILEGRDRRGRSSK